MRKIKKLEEELIKKDITIELLKAQIKIRDTLLDKYAEEVIKLTNEVEAIKEQYYEMIMLDELPSDQQDIKITARLITDEEKESKNNDEK